MTTEPFSKIFDSFSALKASLETSPAWPQERIAKLEAKLQKRREVYTEVKWTGQIELRAKDTDFPSGAIVCHSTAGKMILMPSALFATTSCSDQI